MRGKSLAWVLAGVALALGGVYAVGAVTPAHQVAVQGDTLGRQPGEGAGEYAARSGASLSNSSQPAFALVTFNTPLEPPAAERAVAAAPRVSALLLVDAPPQPIPEPSPGQTRADVFAREALRVAAAAERNGVELNPGRVAAVVVRADGGTLRAIAADGNVKAVEVLPPDAVWGAFGISPVSSY